MKTAVEREIKRKRKVLRHAEQSGNATKLSSLKPTKILSAAKLEI